MLGAVRPRSVGEELVHVHRLPLRPALDHPLPLVVVLVVLRLPVVGDILDAVLVVPSDGSPCAVLVMRPAGLVAVQVVGVGPEVDVVGGVRPDTARSRRVVGVGEVVARLLLRDRMGRGLDDGVQLVLQRDVVDSVVHHVHRIGVALRGRELERAVTMGQTVQIVVGEVLVGRAPEGVRRGHRDVVGKVEDVPHLVVGIGEVLEDAVPLAHRVQVGQTPGVGIVGVHRLHAVPLRDLHALLELVIEEVLQVLVAVVLAACRHRLDACGVGEIAP